MNKKLLVSLASCVLASVGAKANTFGLYDDSFSYSNGSTVLTDGIFEARWGTFTGGVFTPLLGAAANASNSGYVDVSSPELVANLNQTNNNAVAAGSQLALALTFLVDDAAYQASVNEIVLTDPSWVAPVFVFLEDPFVSVSFTPATTALKGNFTYGATGNDTLSTVPEPSTYAAIAGLAALGVIALRRRRSS